MMTKTVSYSDTCDIGKALGVGVTGGPYEATVAMVEGSNRKEGDEYPMEEGSNTASVPRSEMMWELALHQKNNTVSVDDFKVGGRVGGCPLLQPSSSPSIDTLSLPPSLRWYVSRRGRFS